MYKDFDLLFNNLSKSKFRSSFHLNKKMKNYVSEKGIEKVRNHAYEIIEKRIALENITNDGKQTPMRQVHPVFIAQHATATCCRGCLYKWHKIGKNRKLTDDEISYIVDVIIEWINREMLN